MKIGDFYHDEQLGLCQVVEVFNRAVRIEYKVKNALGIFETRKLIVRALNKEP